MFVKDSIHTFFMRSGALILAFLASIVISNLGQEIKGQVAVIIFVASLVRAVSVMGYDVATIYFLRQKKYDYDTIARNLNALIPLLITVWTALLFPLLYYLHGVGLFGTVDFLFLCTCFIIAPLSGLMSIQICFLVGEGEIAGANRVSCAFYVFYLILLIVVVHFLFAGIWGVIAAYAGAFAVSVLVAFLMNRRRSRSRRGFEWSARVIKDMGSYGIRSQAGILARQITNRADLFLTNFYSTAFLAGVYSVALNWAELPQFIPVTLLYVLFPHASGREEASSIELTNRVSRISAVVLLITSAATCALFSMMEELIYKPDYSGAVYPLIIIMPGLVLKGLYRVLMGGMDGLGKPQYSTYSSFAALASTIILNIILIPRFGMVGAAASASVTGAIAFFIMTYFYRKVSGSRWSDFLIVRKADLVYAYSSVKNEFLRLGRR
jgi:O-antigen/teichoic acid export membrane protein